MLKVKNLMIENPVTAKEKSAVEKAIQVLYKRHIGSVVITNTQGKCTGIFTERDAIRIMAQKIPLSTPLKKVMTRKIVTIGEDATFDEARRRIIMHQIRHLPVVDKKGKLVGLLAVRSILDEFFGMRFQP